MIRRLAALTAALVAVSLAGAPGVRADERLSLESPRILCVSLVITGYCVDNPIRSLP